MFGKPKTVQYYQIGKIEKLNYPSINLDTNFLKKIQIIKMY